MLRNTASGLVGLIEIEILDAGQAAGGPGEPAAVAASHDATLGQFLVYLAQRGAAPEPAAGVDSPPVSRVGGRRLRTGRLAADLAADLTGLATQLERALAVTRRKLGRSLQVSR